MSGENYTPVCCDSKTPRGTWMAVTLVDIFGAGSAHPSFIFKITNPGSGVSLAKDTLIVVPDGKVVHETYTDGFIREDDVWATWNSTTEQPVPLLTTVWADKDNVEMRAGSTGYAEWLCASVKSFDSGYVTDLTVGEKVVVDLRDAIIVSKKGDNQWLFKADSIVARCP